jgi:hypothetical protein
MRPLYLMVGFWGERFRNYFVDFCLPSLLSLGNLGSLSAAHGHQFLICTTAGDWEKLQESPLWSVLCKHATPIMIEVGLPDGPSDEAKFRHMTLGHRAMVNAALKDRALACHIMPDAMYTDGTIDTALRYAAAGARAVLTVALRLKEERLFADLNLRQVLPDRASNGSASRPITLKSRSVVNLAVANLYDDSILHDWDGPHFPRWPAYSFWRVPDRSGILIHSAYCSNYILLDMATIDHHNERSFDTASIENSWLSDNFPDPSLVRVVQDSDEAMVISWTPSAPYVLPRPMPLIFRLPGLSAIWKGYRLRCMHELHVSIGDTQKANNIRYPIYWHTGDIGGEWRDVEARARRVMTWFFGDLFEEFSGKTLPVRTALNAWWLILRFSVRLGSLNLVARAKLKKLLRRGGLNSVSARPANPKG